MRHYHLLCSYLVHDDDVGVVVLHRLHQDVCLLLTPGHHQAARIADAGVALVSITCAYAARVAAGSLIIQSWLLCA